MTRADHKSHLTLAEMERQIAETREELGAIVEELAAKTDITGRAKAKAAETASRVRETAHRAASAGPVARLYAGADHARALARDHARDHARGKAAEIAGTAHGAGAHLAGTAQEAGAHLAGPVHEAGARFGAGLHRGGAEPHRVDQDQARVYAVASVILCAATIAALRWSIRHGDFRPAHDRLVVAHTGSRPPVTDPVAPGRRALR
jgi:hypothetical protein